VSPYRSPSTSPAPPWKSATSAAVSPVMSLSSRSPERPPQRVAHWRMSTAAADAALDAHAQGAGVGSLFPAAGEAWADRAGGTSGALWGLGLRRIGHVLGDQDPPTAAKIAAAIHPARLAVIETGGAQVGDKTLVDVLVPFDDTQSNEIPRTGDLAVAWDRAAREAEQAAQATKNLLPRIGRARPHAEKSLGTPDAGAVSLNLVVAALGTPGARTSRLAESAYPPH
jgi:D-erythrulose 4-kinase